MKFFNSFLKGAGIFLIVSGFTGINQKLIQGASESNITIGIIFSLIGLIFYMFGDALQEVSE